MCLIAEITGHSLLSTRLILKKLFCTTCDVYTGVLYIHTYTHIHTYRTIRVHQISFMMINERIIKLFLWIKIIVNDLSIIFIRVACLSLLKNKMDRFRRRIKIRLSPIDINFRQNILIYCASIQ